MEGYRRLGYLYEALFNVGLLKVLNENLNFFPAWLKEFRDYSLRDYALNIFEGSEKTELFKKVLSRVMFHYFAQGYTFGERLLEDLGKTSKIEVFLYYGKPIPVENDAEFFRQRFGERFGEIGEEFLSEDRGSLLHSDLILHLFNGKGHYITVVDLSLAHASELFGAYDHLNREDTFKYGISRIFDVDLRGVAQGYLFKPINLKQGGRFKEFLNKLFSLKAQSEERLREFLNLLEWKNPEVLKLIQAASYAGEYLKFLLQKGVIKRQTPLSLRIFGITLHKVAQISFSSEVELSELLTLLERVKEIYFSAGKEKFDKDRFAKEFYEKLLKFFGTLKFPNNGISVEFKKLKTRGEVFKEIWNISEEYRLNRKKKSEHEKEFRKLLNQSRWIANLGIPGIGKTSTIFKHFGKHSLVLYTSPRTYLNIDVIKKWCSLGSDRVAFYTQAEHSDTVFYHSEDKNFSLPEEIIVPKLGKVKLRRLENGGDDGDFIPTVREVTYNLSANREENKKGVLNRLLKTVTYLLEDRKKPLKGKGILVAFSTQAVLKQRLAKDTFEHIRSFLLDRYKSPAFGGEVLRILEKRFLSNAIDSVVFVLDEVTGSETGRFLFKQFIKEGWFKELQRIAEEKLNLKIYFTLLDASLKGSEVFKTFATDEEERAVIYIDTQSSSYETKPIKTSPVEIEKIRFETLDAVGFPASQLEIYYDFYPVDGYKELIPYLVKRIEALLERDSGQIFLFFQNKELLEQLKKEIVEHNLLKEEEILTVHALRKDRESVDSRESKLILATSSASRGLTFPLVDTYIAVVPHFAVENNLSEMVQLFYRGRGELKEERDGKVAVKTLEDGKRRIFLIFPLKGDDLYQRVRGLEVATLLKSALLTVAGGGALGFTDAGENFLKIVPVGVQREKIFHPLTEFERIVGNTKRMLGHIRKVSDRELKKLANRLEVELDRLLKKLIFLLPREVYEDILHLVRQTENLKTLADFFKLQLKPSRGVSWKLLTVKGHTLFLSVPLVRSRFEIDPEGKLKILRLVEDIERELRNIPYLLSLKELKDFLIAGKEKHTDLKPLEVEKLLLLPILLWEYEDFDPAGVVDEDIPYLLKKLLSYFIGTGGNFYPPEGSRWERAFGLSDLEPYLFDEVNKDFLKSGNLVFSSEVNLLEMLL